MSWWRKEFDYLGSTIKIPDFTDNCGKFRKCAWGETGNRPVGTRPGTEVTCVSRVLRFWSRLSVRSRPKDLQRERRESVEVQTSLHIRRPSVGVPSPFYSHRETNTTLVTPWTGHQSRILDGTSVLVTPYDP